MKKLSLMLLAIVLLALASCKSSPKAEKGVSNVDCVLQDSVVAILERHLVEYDAMDGVAIVMETESGRIRAMVGLETKGDSLYDRADSLAGVKHSSALMRTVSVLAALNSGKVKPDDKFDSEEGVYVYDNDTIYDHNWRKGGYGELTLRQALLYSSNIATVKAVDEAFANKDDFFKSLKRMSFGEPSKVEGLRVDSCSLDDEEMPWYGYAIGCKELAPIQMLTFYNAIANNGKMVMPMLYASMASKEVEPHVINPQIATTASIAEIKDMLRGVITKGLGKRAGSDKVKVAGMNGTIYNSDGTITADFCGYIPADKPRYTVLVSVRRKELPAAGGRMSGVVFKEIAEMSM